MTRTQQQLTTDRVSTRARLARLAALSAAVACVGVGATLRAQPADAGAAQPAANAAPAAAASTNLRGDVEDFWHFARLARYDAANAKAAAVLAASPDAGELLAAFEAAVSRRPGEDLVTGMVRLQGIPELADNVAALEKQLNEGRYARRGDAKFIEASIQRLITNQIGYQNGLANLRNSGEMAVPLMLEYLRDPNRSQYHDAVRRALRDLGRVALNPLTAATESTTAATQVNVVNLLGELGYADAVPFLLRMNAQTQSSELRDAIGRALDKLGSNANAPVDAAFYDLAEKLYYGKSAIAPDPRNPQAYIWYWTEATGLARRDVPAEIFAEVMAMRAGENALAAAQQGDVGDKAMSLWLAANYKREVELAGAADPTRAENQPNAHYYGVTSGPKYLGDALGRVLNDNDAAVAYQVLRSEQQIIGTSTLNVDAEGGSLVRALSSPDRRVRFEAAFALAAAKPASTFNGSDAVVPLLAESLSQTGKPTVLVLAASTDKANAIADPLKTAGYDAVGTASANDAGGIASRLPAVDVVVFDGTLPNDQIEGILTQLGSSPKLKGSARLALVQTNQSVFEELKARDPLLSTTTAAEPDAIKAAVDQAREKAGALAVDPQVASDYALRAATLLERIGMGGGGNVYSLAVAKPTLLGALADERPDVVIAVGRVLAQLDDADAQRSLLAKGASAETDAALRIAALKSLAANAKQFGNKLGEAELAALQTTVTEEANLDVRGAAAEARGALNLPAEQAKAIILGQAQR